MRVVFLRSPLALDGLMSVCAAFFYDVTDLSYATARERKGETKNNKIIKRKGKSKVERHVLPRKVLHIFYLSDMALDEQEKRLCKTIIKII